MYQIGFDPLQSFTSRTTGQPSDAANALTSAPFVAQASDAVSSTYPGMSQSQAFAGSGLSGIFSGFNNLISGLFNTISNLMNSLASSPLPSAGPEQNFNNASLSSWGDPHETISGTTSGGQSINNSWDSMAAHNNLLSSDSFNGGFQISNTVTDPNSNGVTLNSSMSVTTNSGNTQVSLDKNGNASLLEGGQQIALQKGSQYVLGNGELVSDNADGSLVVTQTNGAGGSIAATLKTNGSGGVDLSANAANADLGGYLVTKSDDAGVIGSFGSNGFGQYQPYQSSPALQIPYQPYQSPNAPYQPAQPLAQSSFGLADASDGSDAYSLA